MLEESKRIDDKNSTVAFFLEATLLGLCICLHHSFCFSRRASAWLSKERVGNLSLRRDSGIKKQKYTNDDMREG